MSSYVCCFNSKNRLEHFLVPQSVYEYVLQLEAEITTRSGGIQKRYPNRFVNSNAAEIGKGME
jgi:hypothetical protein